MISCVICRYPEGEDPVADYEDDGTNWDADF